MPKGRGATYVMLHRYLKSDGPRPPDEVLHAAAEILGVRFEYLAHGDGPVTGLAADLQSKAGRRRRRDDLVQALADLTFENLGDDDQVPGSGDDSEVTVTGEGHVVAPSPLLEAASRASRGSCSRPCSPTRTSAARSRLHLRSR